MKFSPNFFILVGVFSLAACGGASGGGGQLALEVENARQPASIALPDIAVDQVLKAVSANNKNINPLIVTRFQVTITGEGIEEPLVAKENANVGQIQVLDISPGQRDILIEAYNGFDEVIRRRLIETVTIKAGVVTPIKTSLHTLPIILNYRNNAVALKSRFRIYGFGEPGAKLTLDTLQRDERLQLDQSVDGDALVISPSISTGLFEFAPASVPTGRQTLQLFDPATNESSKKDITVVENEQRPGMRFVSTSQVGPVLTMGSGIGGNPTFHFPLVMSELTGGQ